MKLQVVAVSLFSFLMALLWPYASSLGAAEPAPAAPAPPAVNDEALNQAKQHFEAGRNAYNAGDFVTAIREFKAAEALRPSPLLAYNIGLANEKLNKKRVAVKYFKRYLEQMPNAPNKAEVEGRIANLEKEIAAQPPPTTPEVQQPADNPPPQVQAQPGGYDPYSSTPPSGSAATPAKKKGSSWWVWLLVAGGAAVLTAIIIAVVVVYADSPTYYDTYNGFLNVRDPAASSGRPPAQMINLFRF
jgi:tetratricopeptide (TPR) repeat protein